MDSLHLGGRLVLPLNRPLLVLLAAGLVGGTQQGGAALAHRVALVQQLLERRQRQLQRLCQLLGALVGHNVPREVEPVQVGQRAAADDARKLGRLCAAPAHPLEVELARRAHLLAEDL
eukprot:scaffold39082_cov66-Phaeocystis_antarctica.AAC.6